MLLYCTFNQGIFLWLLVLLKEISGCKENINDLQVRRKKKPTLLSLTVIKPLISELSLDYTVAEGGTKVCVLESESVDWQVVTRGRNATGKNWRTCATLESTPQALHSSRTDAACCWYPSCAGKSTLPSSPLLSNPPCASETNQFLDNDSSLQPG